MNKQFWISAAVMSIATMLAGLVVHGILLEPEYNKLTATVFRNEQDSANYMHWMMIAHVFLGFAMTWIYRQGAQSGNTLKQGTRFGLALACLTTIPTYLIYLAVLQIPNRLAHLQIMYDVPAIILLGILTAYLNRK